MHQFLDDLMDKVGWVGRWLAGSGNRDYVSVAALLFGSVLRSWFVSRLSCSMYTVWAWRDILEQQSSSRTLEQCYGSIVSMLRQYCVNITATLCQYYGNIVSILWQFCLPRLSVMFALRAAIDGAAGVLVFSATSVPQVCEPESVARLRFAPCFREP